jgi:hypothetical protein
LARRGIVVATASCVQQQGRARAVRTPAPGAEGGAPRGHRRPLRPRRSTASTPAAGAEASRQGTCAGCGGRRPGPRRSAARYPAPAVPLGLAQGVHRWRPRLRRRASIHRMDGTMGERDVRGEVGELCGSGVERKEPGGPRQLR